MCEPENGVSYEPSAPWGECSKDMATYPAQANVASDSPIPVDGQGFLRTLVVL